MTYSIDATALMDPRDYLKFWFYEKRFLLEIDVALIGPLVVAVWAEFVFGQILPKLEYERIRLTIRQRGTPTSLCKKVLLSLSCCCQSPSINCMSDAVVNDVISESVMTSFTSGHQTEINLSPSGKRGYEKLNTWLNTRIRANGYERTVDLVEGRWFTTSKASLKVRTYHHSCRYAAALPSHARMRHALLLIRWLTCDGIVRRMA